MSRSNTNYYSVCGGPFDSEGHCELHQPTRWWGPRKRCIPAGEFRGRRDWGRKKRFPDWSWKSHSRNPPRDIKRLWQRKLRSMMKNELRRRGDVLLDAEKTLIGWYGWWS